MNDFMYVAREGTIRFDYSKALQQAEILEEIAAEIRSNTYRDISDTLASLGGSWKGQSAYNYYTKVRKALEDLKNAADNYDKIAQTIRRIAKRNYDKEMRAIQIARERNYRNFGSGGGGSY